MYQKDASKFDVLWFCACPLSSFYNIRIMISMRVSVKCKVDAVCNGIFAISKTFQTRNCFDAGCALYVSRIFSISSISFVAIWRYLCAITRSTFVSSLTHNHENRVRNICNAYKNSYNA